MSHTIFYSRQGETNETYSELTTRCCSQCGVTYAIPVRLRDMAIEVRGRGWYCPNGHHQSPVGETTEAKLERERQRAGRLAHQLDQTEARRVAQKGATTRAKKRHAAGVCPACKRTFQNVQRHMASQHPDFDPGAA